MQSFRCYIRRIVLPVLLTIWVLLLLPGWGGTAHAEDDPSISLKTEIGYNGKMKMGSWNPVKFTLTSSEDISGDLVIQIDTGLAPATYVQHVELPKDTAKVVIMGVPGDNFTKDTNEIRFYKNSFQKGKRVSFSSGTPYLKGMPVTASNVAVLSEDPDTMNFLNVLRSSGYDLNVLPLKGTDLPEDPMLLDSLDVIVLNRFASDTLSKGQAAAVEQWVRSGGELVLAGGAAYPKSAAAFEQIAPVQYTGTYTASSLPELAKLGGKPLELGGELTLSDASPVEGGEVMYQAGGKPLIASRQVEQGTVLYAAYDLSMEPLASWSGHPSVWSYLLRDHLALSNQPNNKFNMMQNQMYNLINVLDYFPSLKMPSFPVMAWLLIIYAVIVAPVLYWILKKADKREWAWWIIPLIAVIASGTVYMIGAADKTKQLAHTINMLELDGKGNASEVSASAFFTPRSGEFTIDFPAHTYLTVDRTNGAFSSSNRSNSYVEVGDQSTRLTLSDMPQWSLAKVWSNRRENRKVGQFDVKIQLDAKGNIGGQVTNNTSYNLNHAVLALGGSLFELGDFGKGETKPLSAASKPTAVNPYNMANQIFGNLTGGQADEFTREREILMTTVPNTAWYQSGSYVMAWSKDPLVSYTMEGKKLEGNQLNLWAQPVSIDWAQNGKLNIPFGFIQPKVTQISSPGWYEDPSGTTEMDQGSITFEYTVPALKQGASAVLTLRANNPGKKTQYQIFNNDKQTWDPVTWDATKQWKAEKNVQQYLAGGRIRLMLTAQEHVQLKLPEISLKGAEKP